MVIFLLGGPCSGKGTQGNALAKLLNIPHIPAGNLLRNKFPIGTPQRIQIDLGKIINHEIINNAIMEAITTHKKLIIDGYPRHENQTYALAEFIEKTNYRIYTILLNVSDQVLFNRMLIRNFCTICQQTYNMATICCTFNTIIRNDDTKEVFQHRLSAYKNSIGEIINKISQLGKFCEINGENSPNKTTNKIYDFLGGCLDFKFLNSY